ncbi:MAG: DNA-3-methyladenine glycosylase [Planctomycetota bacterium]
MQVGFGPEFFARDTTVVARQLLGLKLLKRSGRRWCGGLIVETEAYLPEGDFASHAARGQTGGNTSMFGQPGTLYVYPIHANHCLNMVTEAEGVGAAVLIRALEPTDGVSQMVKRRKTDEPRRLTSGPGMLCQALGVVRRHDGDELRESAGWRLECGVTVNADRIAAGPRIGISKSQTLPLRFFVDGNRFVSGRASDHHLPRVGSLKPIA